MSRRVEALRALAERGATEGEREAARRALSKYASAQASQRRVAKPREPVVEPCQAEPAEPVEFLTTAQMWARYRDATVGSA